MIRSSTAIKVARTPWQRVRGLLFTKPSDAIAVFPACNDIHTFLMGYPLDVAFIDKAGQVLAVYRDVSPGCRIRCPRAWAAIERPANHVVSWYQQGAFIDSVILQAIQEKEK